MDALLYNGTRTGSMVKMERENAQPQQLPHKQLPISKNPLCYAKPTAEETAGMHAQPLGAFRMFLQALLLLLTQTQLNKRQATWPERCSGCGPSHAHGWEGGGRRCLCVWPDGACAPQA